MVDEPRVDMEYGEYKRWVRQDVTRRLLVFIFGGGLVAAAALWGVLQL